ncbi:4Fe-4S binding protein [bacterium]|nr:4Fe-4S binding protein [bacterium]
MNKTLEVRKNFCPQNHPCPAVRVCPTGALIQKGYAAPEVNPDLCTGCGKCVRQCFPGALRLVDAARANAA